MSMYKPKEFAAMLGISVKTLQRWDKEGKLTAFRSPTNRRYYTYAQYVAYVGNGHLKKGKTVIYGRISATQPKADLFNQVEYLKQFAESKNIIIDEVLEEIGSGLDYERKKWNNLLQECRSGLVKTILIISRDRFICFGYEWFESFLKEYGVEIIIAYNEKLLPKQETVEEFLSIIDSFSYKVNGLHKYKQQIKNDINIWREVNDTNKK